MQTTKAIIIYNFRLELEQEVLFVVHHREQLFSGRYVLINLYKHNSWVGHRGYSATVFSLTSVVKYCITF